MEKITNEKQGLERSMPFQESRSISVDDMEIEIEPDRMHIRGSVDLGIDQESAERLNMMAEFFARAAQAVVAKMKSQGLQGAAPTEDNESQSVNAKFGKAFD